MSSGYPCGSQTPISDEELMRRTKRDDARAFEEIYERHAARAFGLARSICPTTVRAEEAAQDAFLALWRARATYDPARGSTRAWLMTLVRHSSIDQLRRNGAIDKRQASDAGLRLVPAPESIADEVEQSDEATQLRASLQQLPVLQREAIALAYFGGLSHTEIAARLDLPVGTVKGRIRLGLRKVRTEITAASARPVRPNESDRPGDCVGPGVMPALPVARLRPVPPKRFG